MPLSSSSSSSEQFPYHPPPTPPYHSIPINSKMDCSTSSQSTKKNSYSLERFLQEPTSPSPRTSHKSAYRPHSSMSRSQALQSPTSSVGTYPGVGQASGRRPRLLLMGQRRFVYPIFLSIDCTADWSLEMKCADSWIGLHSPYRSGKSSISSVVFHKMPPTETLFLESTTRIQKEPIQLVPVCSL